MACRALLLTLLTAALAQPAADNLIPNPGFETAAGDKPADWSFYSWRNTTGWWDGEVARRGRSLGMQGVNGGWSTSIPVAPETIYTLAGRYQAEGPASRLVIYVREMDGGEVRRNLIYLPIPTRRAGDDAFVGGTLEAGADEQGWFPFAGGDFIPSPGSTQVEVLLKLTSDSPAAKLWLDDLTLTSRPIPTLTPTAQRLRELADGVVWTDDPNRKMLPEDPAPAGDAIEGIRIAAAGNESEVFQLAVTPSAAWNEVDWTWPEFTGPAPLPAEAMRRRLIELVEIKKSMGPFGHVGLNPDPLTDRLPADLAAGVTQGFWFDVAIPGGQPAGEYRTILTLQRAGQQVAEVPLTLTVHGFDLPVAPSLITRSSLRFELVQPREQGEPTEVRRRYYASYLQHRTQSPIAVRVGVRLDGDTATIDPAEWLADLAWMNQRTPLAYVDLPALWISHGGDHKMPADASWQGRRIFTDATLTRLDPAFERPFRDYFTKLLAAVRDAGVTGELMVRYFDEPNLADEPTRRGLETVAQLIQDLEPGVTVALTAGEPHPELLDDFGLWVLHTDGWDAALPAIAAARAAGAKISVYNNAVNFPEHRRLRIRLWPWLLYRYQVDGTYSWWGTVCWRGDMEDPWTCGVGSSGVLLYPPRTPDEQGPIESVRWELYREGLEDYEYLKLAEQLATKLEAAGNPAAARPGRDAIAGALALAERWPNVRAANDEPYSLDVTAVAAARERLAAAILAMTRAE